MRIRLVNNITNHLKYYKSMKKLLMSIAMLLSAYCFAQNNGIDATIGYEDDGLFGSVGYSYFPKYNQFWRVGLNMHIENFSNSPDEVDVKLYTGQLEYYKEVKAFYKRDTKIYLGGGIIGGYENINEGDDFLPNGAKINAESQFIYGATAGFEISHLIMGHRYHGNLSDYPKSH